MKAKIEYRQRASEYAKELDQQIERQRLDKLQEIREKKSEHVRNPITKNTSKKESSTHILTAILCSILTFYLYLPTIIFTLSQASDYWKPQPVYRKDQPHSHNPNFSSSSHPNNQNQQTDLITHQAIAPRPNLPNPRRQRQPNDDKRDYYPLSGPTDVLSNSLPMPGGYMNITADSRMPRQRTDVTAGEGFARNNNNNTNNGEGGYFQFGRAGGGAPVRDGEKVDPR
jgi:hypothetical protein